MIAGMRLIEGSLVHLPIPDRGLAYTDQVCNLLLTHATVHAHFSDVIAN